MSERTEQLRIAGKRFGSIVLQVIAAILVLAIFAGLAFLVFEGRLDGGALLFFSGIIVGYLANAVARTL